MKSQSSFFFWSDYCSVFSPSYYDMLHTTLYFIIPFGKIGPPFLGKATAVCKSSATQSYLQMHAGSFRVSVINRAMAWTTWSLTCVGGIRKDSHFCSSMAAIIAPKARLSQQREPKWAGKKSRCYKREHLISKSAHFITARTKYAKRHVANQKREYLISKSAHFPTLDFQSANGHDLSVFIYVVFLFNRIHTVGWSSYEWNVPLAFVNRKCKCEVSQLESRSSGFALWGMKCSRFSDSTSKSRAFGHIPTLLFEAHLQN